MTVDTATVPENKKDNPSIVSILLRFKIEILYFRLDET